MLDKQKQPKNLDIYPKMSSVSQAKKCFVVSRNRKGQKYFSFSVPRAFLVDEERREISEKHYKPGKTKFNKNFLT